MASRLASTLARNAYRSARAGQGTLAARPNALAGASALAVSAPRRHAAGGRPRTAKGTQSGFSYPGPKALDKIVKVQLLQKHGTPRVREIWEEYHKDHKTAVGDSLTKDEFGTLMQRTKRCPVFVLPVPREGGYFTLLVQWQDKYCLCTYLEDYKKDPAAAMPYLTFTVFDDMVEKKSVALMRGEVTNQMTVPEAKKIMKLIKTFYLGPRHLFQDVVAFNENSKDFKFQSVLSVAQIAS